MLYVGLIISLIIAIQMRIWISEKIESRNGMITWRWIWYGFLCIIAYLNFFIYVSLISR